MTDFKLGICIVIKSGNNCRLARDGAASSCNASQLPPFLRGFGSLKVYRGLYTLKYAKGSAANRTVFFSLRRLAHQTSNFFRGQKVRNLASILTPLTFEQPSFRIVPKYLKSKTNFMSVEDCHMSFQMQNSSAHVASL